MLDDFKPYSIDNYDKLKPRDFGKIFKAFKDKDNKRLEIVRFLAKEAREEKYAKKRSQIATHLGVSEPAALEHCDVLKDIGIIRLIRSKSPGDPLAGPRELIKFYLVVENLIEILAILNAAMLGLDRQAAIKIKEAITKIFNESGSRFIGGIYGGSFLDMQGQILDAFRNIAHNYTQAQKDIINWWSASAEFNMRNYYYPWFYPAGFANMSSKANRSAADYAISGVNMAQNNFDAYIDMSKTYSGLVADNINELSQMVVNSLNMFELMPRALIQSKGTETSTTTLPDVEDDGYDLSALSKLRDELTEILQIALSRA